VRVTLSAVKRPPFIADIHNIGSTNNCAERVARLPGTVIDRLTGAPGLSRQRRVGSLRSGLCLLASSGKDSEILSGTCMSSHI
jgi:hypothetical protein